MKLVIVSDAWSPQTNGVVTVLRALQRELAQRGVEVVVLHPGLFRTWPLPGYRELRVVRNPWRVGAALEARQPDAVHLATEGPLGWAARRAMTKLGWSFSTAMHTKFPEYLALRTGVPARLGYAVLRGFHAASTRVLVQTESQLRELTARGFARLAVVGGAVDCERFRPLPRIAAACPRSALFVGRVAVEKGLTDFLELRLPLRKIVVGDGPARARLERRYPDAQFRGYLAGDALVQAYSDAAVLVFPSRTDTFGLVLLEAMACGTPVAAYPVTGPRDLVTPGLTGCLDEDLALAVSGALSLSSVRQHCRAAALQNSWSRVATRFLELQVPARPRARMRMQSSELARADMLGPPSARA